MGGQNGTFVHVQTVEVPLALIAQAANSLYRSSPGLRNQNPVSWISAAGQHLPQRTIGSAEKHPSRDDAAAFTIAKARQIIDEQGERVFCPR